MSLAISMQYTDFEIENIYITGKTTIEKRNESKGAYVVFSMNGKQYVVESKPLADERAAKGTMDLYTEDLEYNTFDLLDAKDVQIVGLEEVEMDDFAKYITQSILVTIYEH